MICKKCDFFKDAIFYPTGDVISSNCNHNNCFAPYEYIDVFGFNQKESRRKRRFIRKDEYQCDYYKEML